MTLDQYIDSLQNQGLPREEIIRLVDAFRKNQNDEKAAIEKDNNLTNMFGPAHDFFPSLNETNFEGILKTDIDSFRSDLSQFEASRFDNEESGDDVSIFDEDDEMASDKKNKIDNAVNQILETNNQARDGDKAYDLAIRMRTRMNMQYSSMSNVTYKDKLDFINNYYNSVEKGADERSLRKDFQGRVTSSPTRLEVDKHVAGGGNARSFYKDLVDEYREKFKDYQVEFDFGTVMFPEDSEDTPFLERSILGSAITVTGENGEKKSFQTTKDGTLHTKINDFLADTVDPERRESSLEAKRKLKSRFKYDLRDVSPSGNNIASKIGMKNTAWQNAWEDQNPFLGTFYGTGAPKKAGIGWDLKFGDYMDYENTLNSVLNSTDSDVAQVLPQMQKNSVSTYEFTNPSLDSLGISQYTIDKIFKEAQEEVRLENNNRTKNLRRIDNKEKLVEQGLVGEYILDANYSEDYRDEPGYNANVKFQREEHINGMFGDEKDLAILNNNSNELMKQKFELESKQKTGTATKEDLVQLNSIINQLKSNKIKSAPLRDEINGVNTRRFISYENGSYRVTKVKEGDKINVDDDSADITEEYNDVSPEIWGYKDNNDFQGLEERYSFWANENQDFEEFLDKPLKLRADNDRARDFIKALNRQKFLQNNSQQFKIDEDGNVVGTGYYDRELAKDANEFLTYRDLLDHYLTHGDFLGHAKNNIKSLSFSSLEDSTPQLTEDVWGNVKNLAKTYKSLAIEGEVLKDVYLLNMDPADWRRAGEGKEERKKGFNWGQFGYSMFEGAVEYASGDTKTLYSKSDHIEALSKLAQDDLPEIVWNEEQQENFKQTGAEFYGQTLGTVPPVLLEFWLLNKAAGFATAKTGINAWLMRQRAGRVYKNGKRINNETFLATVYKNRGSMNPKAIDDFLALEVGAEYTRKGATAVEKFQAQLVASFIEEGKMQIYGLPTGSGFAFGMFGGAANSIVNRMGWYFTGKMAALNSTLKLGRGAIVFTGAAETAHNFEAAIEDFVGGKDFQTFIDEHYRELGSDEITRRTLGNILTGIAFSGAHMKRSDFAFTMRQKKNLMDKTLKVIRAEEAKENPNKSKLEDHYNLLAETQRQLRVSMGLFRYKNPEILTKEITREVNDAKRELEKKYGEYTDVIVQMGDGTVTYGPKTKEAYKRETKETQEKIPFRNQQYLLDGEAASIRKINGKQTLIIDALRWGREKLPHEVGHMYSKVLGFKQEEFENLYDIIELHMDVATKDVYTKKGYKSFKEYIEGEYKKAGQTQFLGEEKIMNTLEFMASNKDFMNALIKNNAFYGFEQGVRSFYERRLDKLNIFKNRQVKFEDAQDVVNALYRIATSTGKKGVSRQWENLRDLVQSPLDNGLVNLKTNKQVGKSNEKGSLDLFVERASELREEGREDKQLFQSTDATINKAIKDGTWETNKKNIVIPLAYGYENYVTKKLRSLKKQGKLKNFTPDDIQSVALEYITAEKDGLRSKMEAFTKERMINPETGESSMATYLNSSTKQGPLIDVSLRKFIQENPKYGNIIVSTAEKGVTEKMNILDQTTFTKTGKLSIEGTQESKRQREGFGPLEFAGFEAKGKEIVKRIQDNLQKYLGGSLPIVNPETGKPSISDIKGLAIKETADFFGIDFKKLKNFYDGKVRQIGDFRYNDKLSVETGKVDKTGEPIREVITEAEADKRGVKGVREPSEVNSIQIALARNIKDFTYSVPEKNIIPKEGKNLVDVSPELVGRAIGVKGETLKIAYEKTGERPVNAEEWVLKREYNPRVNEKTAIENWNNLFGIKPAGQRNVYSKDQHGGHLKWAVRVFEKLASAEGMAKALEPVKKDFVQTITDVTAGTQFGKASLDLTKREADYLTMQISKPQTFDISQILNSKELKRLTPQTKQRVYQLFRDLASKDLRDLADNIIIENYAKEVGITPKEARNVLIQEQRQWKSATPKLSKLHKVELSDTPFSEIFGKNWPKFREYLGEKIKNIYYPGMSYDVLKAALSSVGRGKYKVMGKDGKEMLISNEIGGLPPRKAFNKFTEAERVQWIKDVYNVHVSSNTKDNVKIKLPTRKITLEDGTIKEVSDIYQPNYTQVGKNKIQDLLKQYRKGEIKSEEELSNRLENEIFSKKGSTYKQTTEANEKFLVESYYDLLVNYSKAKTKQEQKQTLENINNYLKIQTNSADGIFKGLIPIRFASLTMEAGKLGGEKVLYFEHMRELFNVNTIDFQNILARYKNNPKKGKKAIEEMVKNLGQAVTTKSQQEFKDSKEMKGAAGSLSLDPTLNTMLSKGQGFTSLALGTGGKTAYDVVIEKYGAKILKNAIKIIGENNLSSEGIKIKKHADNISKEKLVKNNNKKILEKAIGKSSLDLSNQEIVEKLRNIDKAIDLARSKNKIRKGISVLDFDDTVAISKSKVKVTMPNGKIKKINATEFAKQHESLMNQGAKFDFSDFNKVVGGKKGPLFSKLEKAVNKFGNENVFILTARAPEAAPAIKAFLDGLGVKLKAENIVGLADGRPAAKAQWMIDRAAEGYNDFYFSDDAVANTKAVKKVLDIVDVKSKVQLARKSSLDLNKDINEIIEYATGIGKEKVYSPAKAALVGKSKKEQSWYMAARASDFYSLTNALLGKGKKGLENREWFKEYLGKPFSRGDLAYQTERRIKMSDYIALKNQLKEKGEKFLGLFKKQPLNKKIEKGEPWTNEHAVRVYNWAKQGTLPKDISKSDVNKLVKHVSNNPELKAFAEELVRINKGEGYPEPSEHWIADNITRDLLYSGNKVSRKKHMKEFIENADIIFSPENLNKMEAALGKAWRTNMEDVLERMKTGTNKPSWARGNNWEADMLDFMSGSVSGIMFLNMRSAILQQVSIPNYINITDNNPFAAAKAFSNIKQFSKDYVKLMNDQWSLNRRDGLRYNIQESEIAEALTRSTNKPMAIINWALKKGFVLTKYADSHATAFGGASFYRNRLNAYKKKGLSEKEAEQKALEDWREASDGTQQTSRMDRVSAEQKSVAGRLILPFTSVQLAYGRRYIDDPARDLINKRYDHLYKGENSALKKIGQIIYGSTLQAAVFHALQQGVFKILFEDGDTLDGEELEVANSVLDGILVGRGIKGKALATFKNWLLKIDKERKKENPNYVETTTELLKISPPIDKKFRQIRGGLGAIQYDMDKINEISLDNPALVASAAMVEATTNAPTERFLNKMKNVEAALEEDRADWQRPFLFGGWSEWNFEDDKTRSIPEIKYTPSKDPFKTMSRSKNPFKMSTGKYKVTF